MSMHRHDWYMSEADDGGLYHCRKCRRTYEGTVPDAHGCLCPTPKTTPSLGSARPGCTALGWKP